MMNRPDFSSNRTPQENINLLFNCIQACRTDASIMKYRSEYKNLYDDEIVKIAEALAKEVRAIFKRDEH